MTKNGARVTLVLGLLAMVGLVALLPLVAQTGERREIVIVAKHMAFFGPDGARNPTIKVRPRERIVITLINEDAGFNHDLSIPAWLVATPRLAGVGKASLTFEAPDGPQNAEYVCVRHASMMAGRIEVLPESADSSASRVDLASGR